MTIRKAIQNDLIHLIAMLADDKLGQSRENFQDPLPQSYLDAFENIDKDPHQELMVLLNEAEEVMGTFQLTFIPYLTYQGGVRAQIEAVRIHKNHRGKGLGKFMFEYAIQRTKEKKAHVLQLTTDKKRTDALRFYEDLGFVASHEGMKLHIK